MKFLHVILATMSRRLPSLPGLQAFEAVARHGSFTRAAEELGLTQTAISHRIGRLETQLGHRLFLRRSRQIATTERARVYLNDVSRAFDALYDSTERLLAEDQGGSLTISTLMSFGAKWLVPRIASFQAIHPEIDARILTSSAAVDFDREDIDLAIRYGSGDWPGLRADFLFQEELFPVCSPTLFGSLRAPLDPRDLSDRRLIQITTYPDDWRHWLEATAAKRSGTQPAPAALAFELKFDLAFAAVESAIDGAGFVMGRRSLVENDLAAGRLVAPFEARVPRRAYYLVAPRKTAEQPKVARFRSWLLNTLGTAGQVSSAR